MCVVSRQWPLRSPISTYQVVFGIGWPEHHVNRLSQNGSGERECTPTHPLIRDCAAFVLLLLLRACLLLLARVLSAAVLLPCGDVAAW